MTIVATHAIAASLSGIVVGWLLGIAYFRNLRHAAASCLRGAPALAVISSIILRLAGATVIFLALATWSAAATIFGLIGFTLARRWVVANREPC